MKKLMKKYGGVIFFYMTIIVMVWVVNCRFTYLNEQQHNIDLIKTYER